MRWQLLLEEYGPEIVYIKGVHNTVTDAISRLDMVPKELSVESIKRLVQERELRTHVKFVYFSRMLNITEENLETKIDINNVFNMLQTEIGEIHLPTIADIASMQLSDCKLRKIIKKIKDNNKHDTKFSLKIIGSTELLIKDKKLFVIPTALQGVVI